MEERSKIMTRKKELQVHRRVGIAMSVLLSAQRSAVSRVLSSPSAFAERGADLTSVEKLAPAGEKLYVLNVTPQIRLVYSKPGDGIQVLDLVERATVDRLAPKKSAKAIDRDKGAKDDRRAASKTKTRKLADLAEK
jgi:hypothetical protein